MNYEVRSRLAISKILSYLRAIYIALDVAQLEGDLIREAGEGVAGRVHFLVNALESFWKVIKVVQ